MYLSEGCVILSPTQLIISVLLTLADRQHVSALFKSSSSGLLVDNRYTVLIIKSNYNYIYIHHECILYKVEIIFPHKVRFSFA
jgi:hypothetical protein